MLLDEQIGESKVHGPRPLSLGLSVLAHACVLSWMAGARPLVMPRPQSAYEMAMKDREHKIVWYHFKDRLPELRPPQPKKDNRPMRAETRIPRQSIVSAPRNAPKLPQTIWQKAPEILTELKLDSPNLVAVSLPKIDPPKQFVAPVPQPHKIAAPKIAEVAPPDIQPTPVKPVQIAGLPTSPLAARPLRDFKPPPTRPKAGTPQVSYVEPAPDLVQASALPKSTIPGAVPESVLGKVYRPFTAPAPNPRRGKPTVVVPVAPSPPPLDAEGNTPAALNAVVVGLNPGNQLPVLPPVSRPADFSAGPKLNPKGGAGEGSAAAVTVPDLTIRSGNIDTRATITARNAMPKSLGLPSQTDVLREAAKYVTVDQGSHPSATRVSNAPDPFFEGRSVFMMAIQMQNLTSHSGSWLMWYADRIARPVSASDMTPPEVVRKVDPKYVSTAVTERVEGTVRLRAVIRKDGNVVSVELAKSLDDRLDRTAQEALAKWQFTPALRNGQPIDVDILVEIPFKLAPQLDR